MFEDYLSDQYTNDTINYARENPHVDETMLVNVYDEVEGIHRLGYGIVMSNTLRWSEFFCQYVCDVKMRDSILRSIIAGRLERAVTKDCLECVS